MNIFAIDDDPGLLRVMSDLLQRMGHQVTAFNDPTKALVQLNARVDLVISDVFMSALDGFAVASRVAAYCGTTPPRTLLITGGEYADRLRESLPDTVIGLIRKPPSAAHMDRVLKAIEDTRRCCPGLAISDIRGNKVPSAECLQIGQCEDYSRCPLYNTKCGRMLQEWISREDDLAARVGG